MNVIQITPQQTKYPVNIIFYVILYINFIFKFVIVKTQFFAPFANCTSIETLCLPESELEQMYVEQIISVLGGFGIVDDVLA